MNHVVPGLRVLTDFQLPVQMVQFEPVGSASVSDSKPWIFAKQMTGILLDKP